MEMDLRSIMYNVVSRSIFLCLGLAGSGHHHVHEAATRASLAVDPEP
jgi:hypothetical protein